MFQRQQLIQRLFQIKLDCNKNKTKTKVQLAKKDISILDNKISIQQERGYRWQSIFHNGYEIQNAINLEYHLIQSSL